MKYNAIYYGYLHHVGKLLDIKVTFVRDGAIIREIHIQDFTFDTFKGALNCLQQLSKDVLTDVTEAELQEMNIK